MYMLNMVIILIVMYCNVVTAIDKIPTYLLRFNNSPNTEYHSNGGSEIDIVQKSTARLYCTQLAARSYCHGCVGALIFVLSYLSACDPGRILLYIEGSTFIF